MECTTVDIQHTESRDNRPSRRGFLALAAAAGVGTALGGLPAFTASAAPLRPTDSPMLSAADAAKNQLWWQAPGSSNSMIEQGLPVGNGRLGALASNDPSSELLMITDATLWTGGLNDKLESDQNPSPHYEDGFNNRAPAGCHTEGPGDIWIDAMVYPDRMYAGSNIEADAMDARSRDFKISVGQVLGRKTGPEE